MSPDIFGSTGLGGPAGPTRGSASIPPAAQPPQPWQMAPPPERPSPRDEPSLVPGGDGGFPRPDGLRYEEPPRRRRRGRGIVLTVLALLCLAGLAYAVPAVVMSGKMLPGTTVRGVDIGGLTATEAADRLRDRLATAASERMTLLAAGKRFAFDPEEAGLKFDVVATINQAPSGFPGPGQVWRALTGPTELDPKVSSDPEALKDAVEGLARKIDLRVREGAVTFQGVDPVLVTPRDGRELEREAAVAAIEDAFLGPAREVRLPVSVIKPKASDAMVSKAAAGAPRALSEPITLTVAGRRVRLPVETLAAHLSYRPDGSGGMRPVFDARSAVASVEHLLVDPATAPRDPSFRIVAGKPKLVPGRRGKGVDDERLAADVTEMIVSGGDRTIPVSLTTVQPRMTDAQARELGIKERISQFTTFYDCCTARVVNIKTIARLLDGYVVKPGQTFSLNGIVGQRDTARGFLPAPMIEGGRLVNSVGGGISQFVTTMYNAVFFGGLEDVQHVAHEFHISRYPAGRESTVSWPEPDFRWKNDSPYGVLIKTSADDRGVTVSFWSTRRYEIESVSSERYDLVPFGSATGSGPDCIDMVGQQGFTIDVWRVFKKDGKEIKRVKKTTVYKPETNLKCS
ncbi:VanW family protein [Streptosporangium sp. DT93]|uniref:VanW family protein n=1 Tax=Streptosporangium sp. DT93 TaxID=3393428 RepID=UPI003CEB08A6